MRAFGRDLIRGGHYGQRSCEPHLKAEHMAAPTNAAYVKKALANSEPSTHANSEPSTHGTKLKWLNDRFCAAVGGQADIKRAPIRATLVMSTRSSTTLADFERNGIPKSVFQ